jgi:hypothetical protein
MSNVRAAARPDQCCVDYISEMSGGSKCSVEFYDARMFEKAAIAEPVSVPLVHHQYRDGLISIGTICTLRVLSALTRIVV